MSLPNFETLDKDELPDDVHQELIPQLKQSIHIAWAEDEGPCEGCPNRLTKETCHPQFGAGAPETEVMFVAHTPGASDQYKAGENRKVSPDKIEDAPDIEFPSLQAGYGYSVEGQLNRWSNAFATLRKRLFDDIGGLAARTQDEPGPTIAGFEDTYWTNAKKCSDIAGKGSEEYEEARENCQTYLESEIEYISPDVIVTWGKVPARSVAQVLDYEAEKFENEDRMELQVGDAGTRGDSLVGYRKTTPKLITMPHYSGIRGNNISSMPGMDDMDPEKPITEVYYQLASQITQLLHKSS